MRSDRVLFIAFFVIMSICVLACVDSPDNNQTEVVEPDNNQTEVVEFEGICQGIGTYEKACSQITALSKEGFAENFLACHEDKFLFPLLPGQSFQYVRVYGRAWKHEIRPVSDLSILPPDVPAVISDQSVPEPIFTPATTAEKKE